MTSSRQVRRGGSSSIPSSGAGDFATAWGRAGWTGAAFGGGGVLALGTPAAFATFRGGTGGLLDPFPLPVAAGCWEEITEELEEDSGPGTGGAIVQTPKASSEKVFRWK